MTDKLVNKTPKTDWAPGDTVYYETPFAFSEGVQSGLIQSISGNTASIMDYEHHSHVELTFDHLFDSHQTAMSALFARNDDTVAAYKAEITDITALVKFAYDKNVATCEEYTDWEARAAYRERAKELLGIELQQ